MTLPAAGPGKNSSAATKVMDPFTRCDRTSCAHDEGDGAHAYAGSDGLHVPGSGYNVREIFIKKTRLNRRRGLTLDGED